MPERGGPNEAGARVAPGINLVVMAEGDNVGIATRDIAAGECAGGIRGLRVEALEPIPQGHKIALIDIAPGRDVVRLGFAVGITTAAVERGRLVHVHNVKSRYLNNDHDHFE